MWAFTVIKKRGEMVWRISGVKDVRETQMLLREYWITNPNNDPVKARIKQPPYFGVRLVNYSQKSLLVAAQSIKGHICFTKPFLLKMGCEISGWRFLKFWLKLLCGFYCTFNFNPSVVMPQQFKFAFHSSKPLCKHLNLYYSWTLLD